jgi:hypothetical protein
MVTTAFLGAYGYGNLGDELCLIEAMRAFPSDRTFAFSVKPEWTRRCVPALDGCFRDGAEMLALRPDRVVFGGGMFGVTPAFQAWMPWLARAEAAGAEVHLHNLGVGWLLDDLSWLDEAARGVIARLASFTVRDHLSIERVAAAGFGRLPRITFFPETEIEPDYDLADAVLPRGQPMLGISIIPLPSMRAALAHEAPRLRALLAEFAGWPVVPVVSTVHVASPEEDDMAGLLGFLRDFLPDARIAAPALLDRGHWAAELTPRRLKGLIARCEALVTQRKHNAVHAIGAGVRVLGLHPVEDNSLRRTFVSLAYRLPAGSRCIGLGKPAA